MARRNKECIGGDEVLAISERFEFPFRLRPASERGQSAQSLPPKMRAARRAVNESLSKYTGQPHSTPMQVISGAFRDIANSPALRAGMPLHYDRLTYYTTMTCDKTADSRVRRMDQDTLCARVSARGSEQSVIGQPPKAAAALSRQLISISNPFCQCVTSAKRHLDLKCCISLRN